jgi:hypothetical protein
MSTIRHTPYATGGPLTAVAMEAPLSQLDSAIVAVEAAIATAVAAGSSTSTTLTAQANAGQASLVVASSAGFLVGDHVYIGNGATFETRIVSVIPDATHLTVSVNLTSTYAIGKPVSKSPVELVAARNTYATLDDRLDAMTGFLNAKDFGVKADAAADDTVAAQAALDALIGSSAKGVLFPAGTIRLTAALVIGSTAYQYKQILGMGRNLTIFRQDTSNIPVFKTATEDTHSITFGDLSLTYNVQQTSANTGAIALCFTKVVAGIGNGWYYWRVRDLQVDKAHIGIGIGGPGATGTLPVWNCDFDRVVMSAISMTCVRLISPTTIGMPINTFRQFTHLGGGVTPVGPAIELQACQVKFDGLDIEDWFGRLLYADGGETVVIEGLHTERHHLNTTAPMFEIADQALVILGGYYIFAVEAAAAAVLWKVGAGGSLFIRGARLACTLTSGTIVGLSLPTGVATASVELAGVTDDGNNVPLGEPAGAVGTTAVGDAAGTTGVVANRYYFTAFWVRSTRRVSSARFEVITQAGTYEVAIFDEFGNRLATTGWQTTPAAGIQTRVLVSSILLHPGKKYFAVVAADNVGAAFAYKASATTAYALAAGIASDQAGGGTPFPLPATIAIAASGGGRQYAVDFI